MGSVIWEVKLTRLTGGFQIVKIVKLLTTVTHFFVKKNRIGQIPLFIMILWDFPKEKHTIVYLTTKPVLRLLFW